MCGLLGHSERDYNLVYANHEKEITRAYGVWLRAPTRNANNQNQGQNGCEMGVMVVKHGEGVKVVMFGEEHVEG